MRLSDFDYHLPSTLVAQYPLAERSASRLLDCTGASLSDRRFTDLVELVEPGDLLVFNDTRVIKARLKGLKDSGGRIEVLLERVTGLETAMAQISASHPPRVGSVLSFGSGARAQVLSREGGFYELQFDQPVAQVLETDGELPLPPYVEHSANAFDEERYQTVLARTEGAVAAPTAGLHFDWPLLEALRAKGVAISTLTLHVGAGTFQPIRLENLAEHRMHAERYWISEELVHQAVAARERDARIIAVGTTSVRALESAVSASGLLQAGMGETSLFITPGYQFRIVDRLITNFHLPKSTLLVLVSAFAGVQRIREAYAHAVAEGYRFFSYGDAMLLERE